MFVRGAYPPAVRGAVITFRDSDTPPMSTTTFLSRSKSGLPVRCRPWNLGPPNVMRTIILRSLRSNSSCHCLLPAWSRAAKRYAHNDLATSMFRLGALCSLASHSRLPSRIAKRFICAVVSFRAHMIVLLSRSSGLPNVTCVRSNR